MRRMPVPIQVFSVLVVCGLTVPLLAAPKVIRLEPSAWKTHKVDAAPATYKGRSGVRVTDAVKDGPGNDNVDRLVLLPGTDFADGTIEVDVAGEPRPGASEGARGFVGIAFRVAADLSRFEAFYLRPTNGRAPDQVRRNHSAQYISFPDFPWQRLRKESTEKYETYVDLVPGEWTRVRIDVKGATAQLFVHGASQPALLVDDLKLGAGRGALALWIGPETVAHFANLRVTN